MSNQDLTPGICPEDTLADAGLKVLYFHFTRMLSHENGTYIGRSIENLHQMRVAVRRMLVAFGLFGNYLQPDKKRQIRKGLRQTRKELGQVRDLDIFWEKAALHFDSCDKEELVGYRLMKEHWSQQRDEAQGMVQVYIQSKKYRKFKERILRFLSPPFPHKGEQISVSGFAAEEISSSYQNVLSYKPILVSPPINELHSLRIAFKKFRYTIEFFGDILGKDIQECIKALKEIQDHLGDLNDSRVAIDLLNARLLSPDNKFHMFLLNENQKELSHLVDTFSAVWCEFDGPKFSDNLSSAVSKLELEK